MVIIYLHRNRTLSKQFASGFFHTLIKKKCESIGTFVLQGFYLDFVMFAWCYRYLCDATMLLLTVRTILHRWLSCKTDVFLLVSFQAETAQQQAGEKFENISSLAKQGLYRFDFVLAPFTITFLFGGGGKNLNVI